MTSPGEPAPEHEPAPEPTEAPDRTPAPERRYTPNFLLEFFANPLDPGYADAAARRALREASAAPGEAPSEASWYHRRGPFVVRLAAIAAIGMLFAVAYREAVADAPERTTAHAGLVREVKDAQARTDDLQRRSEDLRQRVSTLRASALAGAGDELTRIRTQEAVTGFGAVTGAGVIVTLRDAPPSIDSTTGKATGADVSRVLDVDLQSVANGLWSSGAEAIAINGQRLTSTSTIRTAGSAVLVDFRPVTSPYTVSAIGPDDLKKRFDATVAAATMRGLVDQFGLGFATKKASGLTLPAAVDVPLRYATPATSATPSKGPR